MPLEDWPVALGVIHDVRDEWEGEDRKPGARVMKDLARAMYGK